MDFTCDHHKSKDYIVGGWNYVEIRASGEAD